MERKKEKSMNKLVEIKITQDEYSTLVDINNTDGAEIPHYQGEFQSLVEKGLVIVSGGRGPGGVWRRVTLTDLGRIACNRINYKVVIEG